MLDIYINKSLWLKICLVGLCILMFISCQSDETAVQNDLAAKQTINRVSEILPTGSKISNEDFTKLKAIYEKYPDSETVFQTYKSALIVRQDWATLEKILKSIPFSELDDEDKTNLGITYFKLGRYNDAIEILKNINNENIPDSKYILTASYFNIGKYDEAKLLIDKNWEQILKAKKTDQINFRGMIYFYEKNYEKAIETLEKTLEINPDDVQAANGLSRIYATKGETEKAEEYLAKVQEGFDKLVIEERQKTNLVEKLHKLQEAYQAKRFQEVIDLANEVLPNAQAKNKAALYQYLYNSYLALGMTKEAQETMAKAKQMQQQ